MCRLSVFDCMTRSLRVDEQMVSSFRSAGIVWNVRPHTENNHFRYLLIPDRWMSHTEVCSSNSFRNQHSTAPCLATPSI